MSIFTSDDPLVEIRNQKVRQPQPAVPVPQPTSSSGQRSPTPVEAALADTPSAPPQQPTKPAPTQPQNPVTKANLPTAQVPQKKAPATRPIKTPPEDDLKSEKGIDYTNLRNLLKAQKWIEADQETVDRMLEAIGKESWWDVKSKDLLNFPCADLKTIDSLWVKYSNGRFGISVQKEIYVECGAKLNGKYSGDRIWRKFGDRVGWRKDGKWLNYCDLNPALSSPRGNMPGFKSVLFGDYLGVVPLGGSLFSRTEICRVQHEPVLRVC